VTLESSFSTTELVNKIWIAFNVFSLKLLVVCNAVKTATVCFKAVKLGTLSHLNNIAIPFGVGKLELWGCPMVKKL